ncbi:MAG: thioether cross-link-forming SCIFF peptide maturase [Firmicutes bacterium]|nr:thioether cross-link-forming SCIFF peptide maturase [Bacillota bacterium]
MIHKFEFDGTKLILDVHSGALHQVDNLIWNLLEDYLHCSKQEIVEKYKDEYNQKEIQEALDDIKELVEQGLLFSDDPLQGNYSPQQSVVKALCLHIAHDCNLKCKYCFAGQGPFGGDRSLMSLETGQAAIDFLLKQSAGREHVEIDFFGGEPLLNFSVVKELVRYGREKATSIGKKIKFTLTTNALLLDEKTEQYLIDNNISVVLSLDGRKEVHDKMRPTAGKTGSYQKVLENIKRMVKNNPPGGYYVRGTYTRHNLDFSKDVLHMLEQGFDDISVEPVVADPEDDLALREQDIDKISDQYRHLTRELLELIQSGRKVNFFHFNIDLQGGPCLAKRLSGCGAGHQYMAVTPEGYLYPCHQFVGRPEFEIGHVNSSQLTESIINKFKDAHIYNKKDCVKCWAKYYCSGGCHANAYSFNKDLSIPHQLGCQLAKIRLECALYLQSKLIQIND